MQKIYKVTGQCLNPKQNKDEILYFSTYELAEKTALDMCSYYVDVKRVEKSNVWQTKSGRVPLFIECIEVCKEFNDLDEQISELEKELFN